MREESRVASNWRSESTLKEYLTRNGIVAISDIDTRALTRLLRSSGVMRGVIATGATVRGEDLVEKARAARQMAGADLVKDVTCKAPFDWAPTEEPGATVGRDLILEPGRRAGRRLKVAAYDLGMKYNILRRFAEHGIDVRVYPATTPAADLMKDHPDGVFFSNGPGDPAALPYVVANATALASADVPIFGICLGHQILAQALGARTFKLKFGHRGTNHPVKHLASGAVEITSQNHGFAVDPESIPADVEVTHVNLYDHTVEGLKHRTRPIFCVQYHPEAAPGPHDADYLFREFLDAMEARA
jgi:carbamoyl-phosphate synthase small subunit